MKKLFILIAAAALTACSIKDQKQQEIDTLRTELDSLKDEKNLMREELLRVGEEFRKAPTEHQDSLLREIAKIECHIKYDLDIPIKSREEKLDKLR